MPILYFFSPSFLFFLVFFSVTSKISLSFSKYNAFHFPISPHVHSYENNDWKKNWSQKELNSIPIWPTDANEQEKEIKPSTKQTRFRRPTRSEMATDKHAMKMKLWQTRSFFVICLLVELLFEQFIFIL